MFIGEYDTFKHLNVLGFCLTLAALFSGTAHAITVVELNPGTPGEAAQDFNFSLVPIDDDGLLRVTFTDNKTLEWDAGSHFWVSPGQPLNLTYLGAFLDSNLDPIPTALFAGRTVGVGGGFDSPIAFAALDEDGVFSGLLFSFNITTASAVDFVWEWDSADTPRVGVGVIPIPAAVWLFASALGLLGWLRRRVS